MVETIPTIAREVAYMRRVSIINKVMIFIVLAVLLVSVISNFLNGKIFLDQYNQKAHKENYYRLVYVKSEVEKNLKLIEGTVNSFSMSASTRFKLEEGGIPDMNMEETYYEKMFTEYILDDEAISGCIYIYFDPDIDGDVHDVRITRQSPYQAYRETEIPLSRYEDNDNMSWFYGPKKSKKSSWIDPYWNRYGAFISSYVAPVFADGRFIGITGMYFDIDNVKNFFLSQGQMEGDKYWLLNQYGEVIYHPEIDESLTLDNYQVVEDYVSYQGEALVEAAGEAFYQYSIELENGWLISYSVPKEWMDKKVRQSISGIIASILFSLIIILFPVFYYGRKYANVFDHIIHVLEEVKKGNLDKRIKIFTNDEIALMSQAINESNENLIRLIQEKNKLAYNNGITDLANRMSLTNDMERVINSEKKEDVNIIYVDIDNFRSINELIGYSQGNELVRKVAEILEGYEDPMIKLYHTNIDEFVFLVRRPMTDEEIGHFLRKILSNFGKNYTIGYHSFYLTLSMGVAAYNPKIKTVSDFYRIADIAIYEAKKYGRNSFVIYNETMYDRLIQYNTFEKDFEKALESGEFVVYYQPKISCRTNKVESVEALVRWNHPDKGLLFPNYFITYAEKSGLISKLGDIVLHETCKQLLAWHDKGIMISAAVNISKRQILDNDFVTRTMDIIQTYNLETKYLEVEVTESMITIDNESTLHKLGQLNDYGIKVSLDDFGTGYSSFNSLKELPLKILKIDKGVLDTILSSPVSLIMTEAIIDLAHKLNLDVVAEGIEERAQMDILKSLGCDMVQGYLYSKPITGEELETFYNKMDRMES